MASWNSSGSGEVGLTGPPIMFAVLGEGVGEVKCAMLVWSGTGGGRGTSAGWGFVGVLRGSQKSFSTTTVIGSS